MTAQTGYDAFRNATNAAFPTRYQFTGREFDSFAKLQYSRARFYNPKLGRFISEDPIGFNGGDINLYGYVWNNSMNFIDPLGYNGWGTRFADWADDNIEYARQYYQGSNQDWVRNGLVDTGADLSFSAADMLRVGNGFGHALYAPDENVYGRAAFAAMDVARAAGLFATFVAPIAKPAAIGKEYCLVGTNIRVAPFGNRTNPPPAGKAPHYHRQRLDSKGRVKRDQGKGRHRPWEKKPSDTSVWDRF